MKTKKYSTIHFFCNTTKSTSFLSRKQVTDIIICNVGTTSDSNLVQLETEIVVIIVYPNSYTDNLRLVRVVTMKRVDHVINTLQNYTIYRFSLSITIFMAFSPIRI